MSLEQFEVFQKTQAKMKVAREAELQAAFDRGRATTEASLREAVDRINQLIAALGSTSMGQIDGARRSALAFLAKMENKP